jgi:hypothetical protein
MHLIQINLRSEPDAQLAGRIEEYPWLGARNIDRAERTRPGSEHYIRLVSTSMSRSR